MITFAKLADARQLSFLVLNVIYSQRVSMEQHTSIFMSKKSTIFLPAGINVFKMTQNKVNDCIKVSIPILDSLLPAVKGITEKSISIIFKQRASIIQE